LHGGSLPDVFKSIKYGWPAKGMKSWKDDFSPMQLAQLASFVKSLQGTKPAAPKEAQGELYIEATESTDSTTKEETTPAVAAE
jgi:cytochrome c oxidase cbb3-type subunit 3